MTEFFDITEQTTAQEIFDYAVAHLRAQGMKSQIMSTCRYRAGELMCAAGPFLTDQEAASFEGRGLVSLREECVLPERLYWHFDLLRALQQAHDQNYPPQWEGRFEHIATVFNLNYAAPEAN